MDGFSDHNLEAISRKASVPKAGTIIVFKRFLYDSYVDNVKNICWSNESKERDPDAALDVFMKMFLPIIDRHAPVRKLITVRNVSASWVYEEIKICMVERGEAKLAANKSGCTSGRHIVRYRTM